MPEYPSAIRAGYIPDYEDEERTLRVSVVDGLVFLNIGTETEEAEGGRCVKRTFTSHAEIGVSLTDLAAEIVAQAAAEDYNLRFRFNE